MKIKSKNVKPKITVIGAGIAGLSVARDLCLRGFEVAILEKNTIASGTTRCAGMIHSGARYVVKDKDLAKLCFQENNIINNIANFAVGKNKALFLTLPDDDKNFHKEFELNCREIGIPIEKLNYEEIRKLEPGINHNVIGGYITPDLAIDNTALINAYVYNLVEAGVNILENANILHAEFHDNCWDIIFICGGIKKVIRSDFVINASGSGLAEVAKIFGDKIELSYAQGTMAVLNTNISDRIISRCAPSASGDTVIPSVIGSLLGSTWYELVNNVPIEMFEKDKEDLLKSAAVIFEEISNLKIVSNITGIRTHIRKDSEGGNFNIKRDYAIIDHSENKKITNFVSVLPGKLTLARYVAEKVGDFVNNYFNLDTNSKTKYTPLNIPTNQLLNK